MTRRNLLAIPIITVVIFLWQISPPLPFPSGTVVTVEDGTHLLQLSQKLQEDNVVRSPFWFRLVAITLGGERRMRAGQYLMARPQSSFVIAWRILHGNHGIETIKMTIPEGFNVARITDLFDDRFPSFDREFFLDNAPEGYLFPDTYFMPITATASSTIKLMQDNFSRQIKKEFPEENFDGHRLGEIIIMASIIESEAKSAEDRDIISGILWKRLELDLPLQVDAAFVYVNGKTTKELTKADLGIDSPFNTYKYKGLPPTPISNPGLESIKAAINPAETKYLYFLTGDDGKMHYSETFEDHVEKKSKYIKN